MDGTPKYDANIHHRRSIRLHGYDYSNPGLYFITICTHNREHIFGHITDIRAGVNPAPTMVLNTFGEIAQNEWMGLPERFAHIELGEFIIMPNHMHGIISITEKSENTIGNIIGAYKSLVANKCLKLHLAKSTTVGVGFTPTLNIDTGNGVGFTPDQNIDTGNRAGTSPAPTLNNNMGNGTGFIPTQNDNTTNVGVGFTPTLNNEAGFTPTQNDNAGNRAGASPAPTTTNTVMMGKIWQRNYYEHIIRNEQSHNKIAEYIINNPGNWHADKFYR